MFDFKNKIVFSVFQATESNLTNELAHLEVRRQLTYAGIEFTEAEGIYDGVSEGSFIISLDHWSLALDYCRVHNQECMLVCYPTKVVLDYGNFFEEVGTSMERTESAANCTVIKGVSYVAC